MQQVRDINLIKSESSSFWTFYLVKLCGSVSALPHCNCSHRCTI